MPRGAQETVLKSVGLRIEILKVVRVTNVRMPRGAQETILKSQKTSRSQISVNHEKSQSRAHIFDNGDLFRIVLDSEPVTCPWKTLGSNRRKYFSVSRALFEDENFQVLKSFFP